MTSINRVCFALAVAVPAGGGLILLLGLLPPLVSVVVALAGVVLFQVGAELEGRWSTILGGVLMFAGAFAAALNGAAGPQGG